MADYNWSPEGQWKWAITGFIVGLVASSTVFTSLELSVTPVSSISGAVLGSLFGWYLRFHDENFHED